MDSEKFSKMAESLRQYRRAELRDFEVEIGSGPVDLLYVDPLPGNAVLQSILAGNTTFLLGRKGTGKSTIFAKAQSELRKRKDLISIYIDVKSLYDVIAANDVSDEGIEEYGISKTAYRAHILRKAMLGKVISELLVEITAVCKGLTLMERWRGIKKQFEELLAELDKFQRRVKEARLERSEIPILQKITSQIRNKNQQEQSSARGKSFGASAGGADFGVTPRLELGGSMQDFEKTLNDNDIYNEYSDVVFRSFPFDEILEEIKILLNESGLTRIFAFFDDFSELSLLDQRLFVDVVLSPLNNASNEAIKLKVAGYPGRVYYGKIDPGKVDTISLDFCDLYEATEVQEMERSATDYTSRLLKARFSAFNVRLEDFFEIAPTSTEEAHLKLMFQASFNVPRIMGHILHVCYLDRVSKGQKITLGSIRLAAKKYFESTISRYFDRMNRFALEPFENKLDRNNQKQLLECLIAEARTVKRRIADGEVGGRYFDDLGGNPPVSHFIVSPDLEDIFTSLESNFFLSRYKKTRDKAGADVIVYALFLGLCESERVAWGYPEGREYRNYFVQRCFDYTRAVHEFLSASKTIKCGHCGHCHPMEQRESIELFKWKCPECMVGICSVVNLASDFKEEVEKLSREIMLEPIELEIVATLNEEGRKMRAGEIGAMIDATHQMVGKRTSKLQDMGLIHKERDSEDGVTRSSLTERCEALYFTSD